jgi:hypothetical protein
MTTGLVVAPSTNASLLSGDFVHNRLQSTSNPLDTSTQDNIFSSTAARLLPLRESIGRDAEWAAFESRIATLEASLTRLLNDQRQNSQGDEHDVSAQHYAQSEPIRPPVDTNDSTYAYLNQRNIPPVFRSDNNVSAQLGDDRVDVAASMSYNMRNLTGGHTVLNNNSRNIPSFAARSQDRSVLIPYEDLRAARASLPEFSGTRAEDPVRFINNSESVLSQAHIHMSGWCRAIEPQLMGTAATWWKSIKVLELSWEEFRVEFLTNFDNDEIQLRLSADILSTRQSATESLTEFILNKNQFARRVNTGLSESELVHFITGFTHDIFRTHIRLRQPSTFAELRRIANILDPVTNTHTPSPGKEFIHHGKDSYQTKKGAFPKHGQPATKLRAEFKQKNPPGPCKFCGELHWQSV